MSEVTTDELRNYLSLQRVSLKGMSERLAAFDAMAEKADAFDRIDALLSGYDKTSLCLVLTTLKVRGHFQKIELAEALKDVPE